MCHLACPELVAMHAALGYHTAPHARKALKILLPMRGHSDGTAPADSVATQAMRNSGSQWPWVVGLGPTSAWRLTIPPRLIVDVCPRASTSVEHPAQRHM